MNMFELTRDYTIPAALSLLPAKMASPQAWGLLLAIAGQETDFRHREQVGGPARGLPQFERPTVGLVLAHPVIGPIAIDVARRLLYRPESWQIYEAMADNDVLACAFARLLLWPDPHPLPEEHEQDAAWAYYARVWKPGRPHPETWAVNWQRAWSHA